MSREIGENECSGCRFFSLYMPLEPGEEFDKEEGGPGTCLRYAPRPLVVTEQVWDTEGDRFHASFPTVNSWWWCGEWSGGFERAPAVEESPSS